MSQPEPISRDNKDRFVIFPNKHQDIWDRYCALEASQWSVRDMGMRTVLSVDLSQKETEILKRSLAQMAIANRLINQHLTQVLLAEITLEDARYFLGLQNALENVHLHSYDLLLSPLCKENSKMDFLQKTTEAGVFRKLLSHLKEISSRPLAEKLVTYANLTELFLTSSILPLQDSPASSKIPGLAKTFTGVMEHLKMFYEFCLHLYNYHLSRPLLPNSLKELLLDQFDIAALQIPSEGGEEQQEIRSLAFIKFSTDRILISCGFDRHFDQENPFAAPEENPAGSPGLAQQRIAALRKKTGVLPSDKEPETDRDL